MRINLKYSLLALLMPLQALSQSLKVVNLQCEYASNQQGVENTAPKLSWELQTDARGVMQAGYRVLVADNMTALNAGTGNIWDSKKVNSGASLEVAYAGKPLSSAKTYFWKVMTWDNQGHQSTWSQPGKWQMGLLSKADWKGAQWIAYTKLRDSSRIVPLIHQRGPKKLGLVNDTLPLIRKTFAVAAGLKRATLYICGLGHFDLSLNGKKVGNNFLDQGWTYYDKQALYVPFDLTQQLKAGKNTIGVMLGNGFYYIPRDKRYRKMTGAFGHPKMICRLVMEYANGRTENLLSDLSWKATPGPVTYTSIYGGEDYDANKEQPGWNTNIFDDSKWQQVIAVDGSPVLNSQKADPLKVMEEFGAVTKRNLANGGWVFDMGQNFSGIPQIAVKGNKGDTVRIYPAELINADGSANQKGSGSPHYYDYVLKGSGVEIWHPQFTYYGFRYLQVVGAVPQGDANPKQLPELVDIKGLHTRNAAATVGSFNCSNDLFNRTFRLVDWAMKSNMASVFTDCPHREKLGWLEEAHLVGSSLRYNYDIHRLALKCMNDMRVAQTEDGLVPEIAPEFTNFGGIFRDSPEWGSNCIIFPWYIYQWYGDKDALAKNYETMKRYLGYLSTKANNNILSQGLGDWYDQGPKAPGLSQQTPQGITATAFYYYDLNIVAKIADMLGNKEDAESYRKLAADVKSAYNKSFFNADTKQYGTGSQTANAISVYMGLVDDKDKAAVIDNIIKDLRSRNNALTSGDIGFRYLLRALDDAGHSDVIFDMNSRDDVPGYGYQLKHGATALTESWGALPSVSNNHFMLGDITEWFYSGLGGIRAADDAVAFNKIEIRPEMVGDVNSAHADYHSPYGTIATDWKKDDHHFTISVSVPANSTAVVYLPVAQSARITEGGKVIVNNKNIKQLGYKDGKMLVAIGSGKYNFEAGW